MADAAKICLDILERSLPGIPVTSELPFERPEPPMIQISRTGGEEAEFLSKPVMQMLCWGGDDPGAQALCMDAVHALKEAAEGDDALSAVDCQSMSRDEWAPTGEARYRAQLKLVINI